MANTYQRMLLTIPTTTVQFVGQAGLHSGLGPHEGFTGITNYLQSINGGIRQGRLVVASGEVFPTATMTSTGAAVADEIFTLANVVFTAKNSGTVADTFVVSGTVATQAANIAAAINASTGLSGICTATSALGVVTITPVIPGKVMNGLQFSEALTNVTITQFLGGTDGTAYTMTLM